MSSTPAPAGDPIIETRNLTARYEDTTVLSDISLEIKRGEVLTILGPSGCGKTTLLKHLIGLAVPTSGSVLFHGGDIANMDEDELEQMRLGMGVLFQGGALFGSMTVEENVVMPLVEHLGMDLKLAKRIAQMKLSLVQMQRAAQLLPGELSGGMKKRAGLARAMALDPEVMFFDEPSAGLDPITSAELDELILNLNRSFNITLVVVTHELHSIFSITRRAIMLEGGKIAASGSIDDLMKSDNPKVKNFLERRLVEKLTSQGTWLDHMMVSSAG